MTPIAWVVEHSLQASERFRHLTVTRDPNLDFVDIDAMVYGLWQDDPDGMRVARNIFHRVMEDFK